VDASGGVYVTGDTSSADFPTPGGYDTSHNGGDYDAFVAKFSSAGSLLWSTFLGGSSVDSGYGITVNASGGVYVTGKTSSANFPTLDGYDTSYNSGGDAFVAKFSSAGSLLWSTFLGGSSSDTGRGITTDASGGVYVTGRTYSADFPTLVGYDTSYNGDRDAFVAKFSSAGSLLWSTFLGGNDSDWSLGITADASGDVYVTGETYSADFPTPAGYDTSYNGDGDAFIAKFSSAGSLLWSTFLGGNDLDQGFGIATDASGGVYVTGRTYSADFPTPTGYDTSFDGDRDAFVAKFSSAGSLLWSTFMGGSSIDYGRGITTDASGGVYVTGHTWSADFPTPGGYDTSHNGYPAAFVYPDAFVAKFVAPGDLNGDFLVNAQDINPFVLAMTNLSAWQAAYPLLDIMVVGDCSGDSLFNAQDINPFTVLMTGSAGAGQAPQGQASTAEATTAEYTESPLASPVAGRLIAAAKATRGKSRAEVMAPVLVDTLAAGPANLDGDVEVDLFEVPAVRRRNFGQAAHPSSPAACRVIRPDGGNINRSWSGTPLAIIPLTTRKT